MNSYVGNSPTTGHFPTDTFTSSGGSTYTLSKAPATLGSIEVSVQGVLQAVSAYTINGTELELVGVANDDVIFVRHLGETLQIPTPGDDSVTTVKIAADAVDGTKIADNAIDSDHYVNESIDTVHIADNAITAAKIANGTVVAAEIATDAVTTIKILDGAVTAAKINSAVALGGPSLGVDSIIRTNAKTISTNITFAGTENGMTAGPITIANNCSVVVTNGSSWTIV